MPRQPLLMCLEHIEEAFWPKTDTYLEQPEVTFTKQLLVLAEGFAAGEPLSASFATLAGVNGLNHARLRDAVVKVSRETYRHKLRRSDVSDPDQWQSVRRVEDEGWVVRHFESVLLRYPPAS